jgi:hypothetical protein
MRPKRLPAADQDCCTTVYGRRLVGQPSDHYGNSAGRHHDRAGLQNKQRRVELYDATANVGFRTVFDVGDALDAAMRMVAPACAWAT